MVDANNKDRTVRIWRPHRKNGYQVGLHSSAAGKVSWGKKRDTKNGAQVTETRATRLPYSKRLVICASSSHGRFIYLFIFHSC